MVIFKDLQKLSTNLIPVHKNSIYCIDWDEPFWYWDKTNHEQANRRTKGGCCLQSIMIMSRLQQWQSIVSLLLLIEMGAGDFPLIQQLFYL